MSCAALIGFMIPACTKNSTPVTPNPATSPTPAPVTSPTPAAFSCPLPPSHKDDPNACYVGRPTLGPQINSAIDRVIATRPELFNMNDMEVIGGNPRVLDRDAYWQAVKTELEKQGVCTIIEKEELAVKITNTYNEQWNLYTSVGFVRRKYVTTCEPSWF
ncbi:MAG: hypothetical protein DMF79_13880 [Acidobacteria bacterium]|nr:MAG: hypothetical protein DMF79_13880 [Acidobacteriota bacterium]